MARKAKTRTGVHIIAPTPYLYRYFVAHASPYVATRADDGSFTVLDESRWSALLSASEASETP